MIKKLSYVNVKVVVFDADDTLWVNETYFREAEYEFVKMLNIYGKDKEIDQRLFNKEIANLAIYGYGIKGFILSMIECALEVSNHKLSTEIITKILAIGKEMIKKPIVLIDGVEEVLQKLQGHYKLVVATKGDLLDQENKLKKSGLLKYFHHVQVMSDKKEEDYIKLIKYLDVKPSELLMIGNSLKSDVLPLINIGALAIHIPFHTTWAHEKVSKEEEVSKLYTTLQGVKEVLDIL